MYHHIFTNKIMVINLHLAVTPDVACMIVFAFTSYNSQLCVIISPSSWVNLSRHSVCENGILHSSYVWHCHSFEVCYNCLWFGLFLNILWWLVILLQFVAFSLLALVEIRSGVLWLYISNSNPKTSNLEPFSALTDFMNQFSVVTKFLS